MALTSLQSVFSILVAQMLRSWDSVQHKNLVAVTAVVTSENV